jgi:hypothetical protein
MRRCEIWVWGMLFWQGRTRLAPPVLRARAARLTGAPADDIVVFEREG